MYIQDVISITYTVKYPNNVSFNTCNHRIVMTIAALITVSMLMPQNIDATERYAS